MNLQNEVRQVGKRIRDKMNKRHRERHIELHRNLDELCADWAAHQPMGKLFSNSTIMELIEWSHKQTQNPD